MSQEYSLTAEDAYILSHMNQKKISRSYEARKTKWLVS